MPYQLSGEIYIDGDIKSFYVHILQKINVSLVPRHHILLRFVPVAYHKILVEPHSRSQEKVLINRDS
jgi:hypothetical protein